MSDRPRGYRGEHRAGKHEMPKAPRGAVTGETDPIKIKAQLGAITADEQARHDQIRRGE